MQLRLRNILLIIFLVLFNNASLLASNNLNQFYYVKANLSNWVIKEWNKTVEFQKEGFYQMKSQAENKKKEINKIFNHFK